jgi:hypothetical protein
MVRPERFELPTYSSGGCPNAIGLPEINGLSPLQRGIARHYRRQLNTF